MTREKMTISLVQARKAGPKLTMITTYDTPLAAIADLGGADPFLVRDLVADNVLARSSWAVHLSRHASRTFQRYRDSSVLLL